MRLIAFVLAAFVAVGSASAQSWTEYSYPDYAFAVAFPADPQIKITTYKVSDGRSVPARVYSVRRNDVVFKMTVAALAGARLEESAVIDHAIRMLSESTALPDRGHCASGRKRFRSRRHALSAIAHIHRRPLEPLRGRYPRYSRRLP